MYLQTLKEADRNLIEILRCECGAAAAAQTNFFLKVYLPLLWSQHLCVWPLGYCKTLHRPEHWFTAQSQRARFSSGLVSVCVCVREWEAANVHMFACVLCVFWAYQERCNVPCVYTNVSVLLIWELVSIDKGVCDSRVSLCCELDLFHSHPHFNKQVHCSQDLAISYPSHSSSYSGSLPPILCSTFFYPWLMVP